MPSAASGQQCVQAKLRAPGRMTSGPCKISDLMDYLHRPTLNFKKVLFPASKIYEKKPEVMEEMKRNNFPFEINSKIETDFELRSQEETRF
jgi:hypothetical protein